MTKINQPQSQTKSSLFSFKNGALTVGLALTMLFSSCGKKTEETLNNHDTRLTQTEQIDSVQTVRLTEHTELIEGIIKKLNEQWVKIENLDTLTKKQTEAITKLYENDAEFKKQLDELNKVVGKCCETETIKETPKKKPAPKKPSIENENAPSDTTKTVKPGAKKDGEAFSF